MILLLLILFVLQIIFPFFLENSLFISLTLWCELMYHCFRDPLVNCYSIQDDINFSLWEEIPQN